MKYIILCLMSALTIGCFASSEAQITVFMNSGEKLTPAECSITLSSLDGVFQTQNSNEEGVCLFDLTAQQYQLDLSVEGFPSYSMPFSISSSEDLSTFGYSVVVSSLTNVSGNLMGAQINSFQHRAGHDVSSFKYSQITTQVCEMLSSKLNSSGEFMINSCVYYDVSRDEMRAGITRGEIKLDHDEISNVFYKTNESYEKLVHDSKLRVMEFVPMAGYDQSQVNAEQAIDAEADVESSEEMVSSDDFYSVQLGVFRKDITTGESQFVHRNDDGLNTLCQGEFSSYDQAQELKVNLLNSGVEGVFVVGFRNGQKVSVLEMD